MLIRFEKNRAQSRRGSTACDEAGYEAGCRPVLIPDRRAPTPEILEICETFPVLNDAITLLGGML